MAVVPVSQLKPGERLKEDVTTRFGSVLLQKGKNLYQRELDVLKAFMVYAVSIEPRTGDAVGETVEEKSVLENDKLVAFHQEFDKTVSKLKRLFQLADSGGTLPILEIRNQFESLITSLDQYNILTFTNKKTTVSEYLYTNSLQIALTSYLLARWYGLPQKDWIQVAMAGLLHDVGNVRIDSVILNKPTKLSNIELEEMRKHTILGYNILKNVAGINEGVKLSALQHHEKEDGSGYPLGLKGDKIHIYAKIVAVADIFHAMTSHRSHKKAQSPYLVLEQLVKESFGKLEPMIVQTFLQRVTSFHNGTVVRLSNGTIGEIVFTDRNNATRPMVNINGKIINLAMERSLYITEVIKS